MYPRGQHFDVVKVDVDSYDCVVLDEILSAFSATIVLAEVCFHSCNVFLEKVIRYFKSIQQMPDQIWARLVAQLTVIN